MREPRISVSSDSFSRAAMFIADSEGDTSSASASLGLSLSMLGHQDESGTREYLAAGKEESVTADAVSRVKEFGEKVLACGLPDMYCLCMRSRERERERGRERESISLF
jgi:hypothetical protein